MQVTIEDLSSIKKTLHIEVPADQVTRELDKAYQKVKKNAKIKGFRPNKAPRSVLERMFKKDVHADVSSQLIQSALLEAVQSENLQVVGPPQVEPPELIAKEAYKFDATVEVQPEIADIDYKGLALTKTRYKLGEEEVEGQLKMLQKNMAQQKTIEEKRPVQKDDFVLIAYEGFENDQPFAETQKTENFTVKVGQSQFTEKFDEGLIGMAVDDEKEIVVTFADDHENKNLAGHTITFKVTLSEIREEVLPEIDDAFAKDMGKYDSLEALKTEIKTNLSQGYDKRTEQELNEQIFTALLEKTEFEVPDALIDYELEATINDAERTFTAQGQSLESFGLTREGLAETYRDTAEKQVKRQLILRKLIEQLELNVDDTEVEDGFVEMAQNFNQPIEDIKAFYRQSPDKLDFFKHALLEKKVIGLIMDGSTITEKDPEDEPAEKDPEAS
jgi:trigger factor